jgi:uncharacterized lipoprotein YajG
MKLLAILFASMLLTACAAKVTAATDRMVIVRAAVPDMGVEKALVIADAECAKRGRAAVVQSVTNPNTDKYIFSCVAR